MEMQHNQGNGAQSGKWSRIMEMKQVMEMEHNQGNKAESGK